jgi:hypothetical protein
MQIDQESRKHKAKSVKQNAEGITKNVRAPIEI